MSKDTEGLARTQLELYGRISRAYENLKKSGAANSTVGLVEARLQALESNWAKFEAQHDKLVSTSWDALAEHDYRKKDVMILAEEVYLIQKGAFLDALRALKSKVSGDAPTATSETSPLKRTTLPRIQLPQFSGRYEDWPSFRDLFNSIIGSDSSTSQVEKLHYLKVCLKGEAEALIRSLPTTDENFGRTRAILIEHYENKRILVRSYLSTFTSLHKLKGESVADLRKLYHAVISTAGALKSIGRPINREEDLFVYLIIDLMDTRSRREWENSLKDTTIPPTYAELIHFLERRVHMLESLQPAKPKTDGKKKRLEFATSDSLSARSQTGEESRSVYPVPPGSLPVVL